MHMSEKAAAIGLSAALLTGCTAAEQIPGPTSAGTLPPTPSETSTTSIYFHYDPCQSPYGPDRSGYAATSQSIYAKSAAGKCAQLMQHARVVLVDFAGLSSQVEQEMATKSQELLQRVSGGILTASFEAMNASPAAQKSFDTVNQTCEMVQDNQGTQGTSIAQQLMPETQSYDFVVGLSSLPSCDGSGDLKHAGGVFTGGASIELFGLKDKLSTPAQTKTLSSSIQEITPPFEQYQAVVHELLHGFGLAHANQVVFPGDTKNVITDAEKTGNYKKISFDFQDVVKNGQFIEYFEPNQIMGGSNNHDRSNELTMNAIMRNMLAWPNRIQGDTTAQHGHDLAQGQLDLSLQAQDSFATVKLEKPVKASDFKSGAWTLATAAGKASSYATLAIAVRPDTKTLKQPFIQPQLYLVSEQGDTLYIGDLIGADVDIRVGSKTVHIDNHSKTAQVSLK